MNIEAYIIQSGLFGADYTPVRIVRTTKTTTVVADANNLRTMFAGTSRDRELRVYGKGGGGNTRLSFDLDECNRCIKEQDAARAYKVRHKAIHEPLMTRLQELLGRVNNRDPEALERMEPFTKLPDR